MDMPDTFGKRERRKTQERKAMLRDERRDARRERKRQGPVEEPELELLTGPAAPIDDEPVASE
jgi:hypothetical protein